MEEFFSTGMFSPASASEDIREHYRVPAWGYAMDLGNSSQAGWAHRFGKWRNSAIIGSGRVLLLDRASYCQHCDLQTSAGNKSGL